MDATNYKPPEDINEEYINLFDRFLSQSYPTQPEPGKGIHRRTGGENCTLRKFSDGIRSMKLPGRTALFELVV